MTGVQTCAPDLLLKKFMLTYLLYLLTILMGIPAGLILKRMCSEEIKAWKKRLIIISFVSLLGMLFFLILSFEYKIPIILNLLFIIIVSTVLIIKK